MHAPAKMHASVNLSVKKTSNLVNDLSVCHIIQLRSLEIDIHAPLTVLTTHSLPMQTGRLSGALGQLGQTSQAEKSI